MGVSCIVPLVSSCNLRTALGGGGGLGGSASPLPSAGAAPNIHRLTITRLHDRFKGPAP